MKRLSWNFAPPGRLDFWFSPADNRFMTTRPAIALLIGCLAAGSSFGQTQNPPVDEATALMYRAAGQSIAILPTQRVPLTAAPNGTAGTKVVTTYIVPVKSPEELDAIAEQNRIRAFKFYFQQATNGDDFAQYRIGQYYRDGAGVRRDLRKAREWLAKAAAQGQKDAAKELAQLPPDHRDQP